MNRFFAAQVVFLMAAAVAPAQVVTISRIANMSTVAPGGTATFSGFGSPTVDGSTVAFTGTVGSLSAIYTGTGSTISTLVPAGASIPNGNGSFTSYGSAIAYKNGTLVFYGVGAGQGGIYTSNGTTLSRLVDINTAIPGGTGNFTGVGGTSMDNGTLAFNGGDDNSAQRGIYISAGGTPPAVALVANQNTAIPGGTSGNFTYYYFGTSAISGTTVVFRGGSYYNGANHNGIFQRVGAGPVTTVADDTTLLPHGNALPNGNGKFWADFDLYPSISGSNVSFVNHGGGYLNDSNGVFERINGVLTTIADTSTVSPNGTGNFRGFLQGSCAPLDGTEVAFVGYTTTSVGVYLYDGSALRTLIDSSNAVFDGQPLYQGEPFFLAPGSLSGNQLAFTAYFGNSNTDPPHPTSSGIYLATFTPVPEPSTLALVGMAALALLRRCRRRLRISAKSG